MGHMCSSPTLSRPQFGATFLMQLISALNEAAGAGMWAWTWLWVWVWAWQGPSCDWAKVFGGVALCVFRTQVGTTHKLVWQQHVAYCLVPPSTSFRNKTPPHCLTQNSNHNACHNGCNFGAAFVRQQICHTHKLLSPTSLSFFYLM